MTATTFETDIDSAAEEIFKLTHPCDGKMWIPLDCDNESDYRCQVACCGGIIWWCEECLFAFIELASDPELEGYEARCLFCEEWVPIDPNHVRVIGRIE